MIKQQVSGTVLGLALSMAAVPSAWAGEGTVASEPAGAVPTSPAEFIPPDDGYDWLQLVSGEWLKGELIGLFDGDIEFDSEVLDKLVIDAEDVRDVHSSKRFGISVRGEEILIGTVSMHGDRVIVDTGSQQYQLPRQDLVAMTASAERERDRWSGDINLGVNLRQGNVDRTEYNMVAGLDRRTPNHRLRIDYIGSYNKTADIETANDHRLNFVLDRFSGSRLFWRPILGQYLRDPFQNVEHQFTLETGLGYSLVDNGRTEWEIYSGVGANRVRRVSVEAGQSLSSTSPAFTLGTDFETELTSWMDYLLAFQMTFLDEEAGEYQHHLITTLSTDLVGELDLDLTLVWDRTRAPPPLGDGSAAEKDDYRLITSIGFEF